MDFWGSIRCCVAPARDEAPEFVVEDVHGGLSSDEERLLEDSADKHANELAALKDSHKRMVEIHGKSAKDVDALKTLHAHHATMAERLDYMEKVLGDSADKHFQELQALKVAHQKHVDALTKSGKDSATALQHHANVSERIAYIEKLMGDSSDHHTREIEALKAAHGLHAKELAGAKDAASRLSIASKMQESKHLSTAERLDMLESRLKHCFAPAP